jgi:nucleoside-diphosphate-sugar epimerase
MENLIDFCGRGDCPHVIQMSSVAVYGNATVGTGRDESSTPRRDGGNPLTASLPYGRTKARAEAILEASGLPWSAPRLPAVFGPGDTFLTPSLWRFISRGSVPFAGDGDAPVSIMDVTALGSLIKSVVAAGPLRRGLNASSAAPPWREIVAAYAHAWQLPMTERRLRGCRRWKAMFDFGDAPGQMMAHYSAHGAEFPDREFRNATKWQPEDSWSTAIDKAASSWVAGYGEIGEWGREHPLRHQIKEILGKSAPSSTG